MEETKAAKHCTCIDIKVLKVLISRMHLTMQAATPVFVIFAAFCADPLP
jgi:hypothetical protein